MKKSLSIVLDKILRGKETEGTSNQKVKHNESGNSNADTSKENDLSLQLAVQNNKQGSGGKKTQQHLPD